MYRYLGIFMHWDIKNNNKNKETQTNKQPKQKQTRTNQQNHQTPELSFPCICFTFLTTNIFSFNYTSAQS